MVGLITVWTERCSDLRKIGRSSHIYAYIYTVDPPYTPQQYFFNKKKGKIKKSQKKIASARIMRSTLERCEANNVSVLQKKCPISCACCLSCLGCAYKLHVFKSDFLHLWIGYYACDHFFFKSDLLAIHLLRVTVHKRHVR